MLCGGISCWARRGVADVEVRCLFWRVAVLSLLGCSRLADVFGCVGCLVGEARLELPAGVESTLDAEKAVDLEGFADVVALLSVKGGVGTMDDRAERVGEAVDARVEAGGTDVVELGVGAAARGVRLRFPSSRWAHV